MSRTLLFAGVLSLAGVLLLAGSTQAQIRSGEPRYGGGINSNRPPGWDWWRTYPWSPYNYGRNPYNPAVWPYPGPSPYPNYVNPYPYPYYPQTSFYAGPQPLLVPSPQDRTWGAADAPNKVLVPSVTGPVQVPPAGCAVIRVHLPDPFAQVWFDGVKTSSIGATRWYVTPELTQGPMRYDLRAQFNQGGQTVTRDQVIAVNPGRTTEVDFGQ